MHISVDTKVRAKFKMYTHKGDGVPTSNIGWFNNKVLNTGLVRMGVGNWINRCVIGTGNSEPQHTQTMLDAVLASTTTQIGSAVISVGYPCTARITWRFDMGVAAGNISEVGLGWANNNLWNRALVKDHLGNPTTITVLSDEYLDVVSEIQYYSTQSFNGAFNYLSKAGVIISEHTYAGRPYDVGFNVNFDAMSFGPLYLFSGNMGSSAFSGPMEQIGSVDSPVSSQFISETQRRAVYVIGLSIAVGIIKSFRIAISGLFTTFANFGYQLQINPTITKTNTQELSCTFDFSWGRYEPA